ncbi:MAG TPA: DUF3489 domain-containing protein [Xanthobacteraceae bacterium]|nr:DUF3489 domain-containing protein [Xanthobacteraceae bacterium]
MSKSNKKTKKVASKPSRVSETPGRGAKATDGQKQDNPSKKSKRILLIELLRKKDGATIDTIVKSLKWLPHSGRAAISNLRKTGYKVEVSTNKDGKTVYCILGASNNNSADKSRRGRS